MKSAPTTVVSTKGQVILPKAVRDRQKWDAGTRLVVEDRPDGVLLKRERLFPETRLDDVAGSLRYDGPPKTIAEMDAGVLAEAKRRHLAGG